MTDPAAMSLTTPAEDTVAGFQGAVAAILGPDGAPGAVAKHFPKGMRQALDRLAGSDRFAKMKSGDAADLGFPAGLAADRLVAVKMDAPGTADARKAGVAIARAAGSGALLLCLGGRSDAAEISLGAALRRYEYRDQKGTSEAGSEPGPVMIMASEQAGLDGRMEELAAQAAGVFFCRDLVNAPANVLTTTEYAHRLSALSEHGLEVEVLEEHRLAELGMGALLSVGQGSDSPSKVVVMRWNGGGDAAPLALVGKGVVFDTGGISLKPAGGMEEMTMDMGGSAVVAGVMKTLALRKAKANVVGLVGLVENMPSGSATRPGDVVRSMKGDTIEVINTDAEGRLVLADVMWYAQETLKPAAMIDFATLTGAIIIGLGHHRAGIFCNDEALASDILSAAAAEGEGAWRMPLGEDYAEQLKSRIADVKNVGGRPAGSITAAEFLRRFVQDGMAWAHVDIAGVAASFSADSPYAPKGATGWGVRAIDRLIRDRHEG